MSQVNNRNKGKEAVAAVVDDTGRFQAQFVGRYAQKDATEFLKECQTGGVEHLQGASIVTGTDAKKVIENGRI